MQEKLDRQMTPTLARYVLRVRCKSLKTLDLECSREDCLASLSPSNSVLQVIRAEVTYIEETAEFIEDA